MNWEESKALTPLKRDFLKAFFDRSQAFFLTGGSALGIFYGTTSRRRVGKKGGWIRP